MKAVLVNVLSSLMPTSDAAVGWLRTVVPMIVGGFVTWLGSKGIDIDATLAITFVSSLVMSIWYSIGRAIETSVPEGSQWRFLAIPFIGVPRSTGPAYTPPEG